MFSAKKAGRFGKHKLSLASIPLKMHLRGLAIKTAVRSSSRCPKMPTYFRYSRSYCTEKDKKLAALSFTNYEDNLGDAEDTFNIAETFMDNIVVTRSINKIYETSGKMGMTIDLRTGMLNSVTPNDSDDTFSYFKRGVRNLLSNGKKYPFNTIGEFVANLLHLVPRYQRKRSNFTRRFAI